MAALTTQNANLVRQKAYNAVYGSGTGTTVDSVSPYHFYALKMLFLHLAANKGNPDLQFLPFADEDIATTDTGFQPISSGACTLYAFFGKSRRTSGTSAAFIEVTDAADDFDTSTTTIFTQLINAKQQQFMFVWPNGFPIATALNIGSVTAVGGATISAASVSVDGFAIVGA